MDTKFNLQNDPLQRHPKWSRYVTECPKGDVLFRDGDQAEKDVVRYLLDNLTTQSVGEYRILMNYHMPVRSSGPAQTQEIDIVLINKYGIYLLEVKDRRGKIVAYDSTWLQDGRDMRGNPLLAIESKARVFKSHWFDRASDLRMVFVKGLVVLAHGKALFENRSNYNDRSIVGIDSELLKAVTPPPHLINVDRRILSDEEIGQIQNRIFRKHTTSNDVIIEDYRLENKLLPGGIYTAYEARNVNLPSQRVRIKIYQSKASQDLRDRARRDADAVSKLGHHPNILYTINFIPDPDRSDLYYEVTELIDGVRLDKLMANRKDSLPFNLQMDYLKQMCTALAYAHSKGIIHRNICPETVYVTRDGVVKLADFDFAKVEGVATIVDPSIPLIDSDFTPPELYPDASNASPRSDLYSLGCLWLYMASWPVKELQVNRIQSVPIPDTARDLMKSLLSHVPAKRPQTADELLQGLKKCTDESQGEP